MNTEHASPELFKALAEAQAEIENAGKNATNPHFKSKYADLAEVLTTIRETLPKHGLSLVQSPSYDGSMASVTTILAHAGGGYITATASCVPAKSDAQGIGAATTYLRRYSAAAMAGIAQEDDDGQAAAHTGKPNPVAQIAGSPQDGMRIGDFPEDRRPAIQSLAESIALSSVRGKIDEAAKIFRESTLSHEEKTAAWFLIESKYRTALTPLVRKAA